MYKRQIIPVFVCAFLLLAAACGKVNSDPDKELDPQTSPVTVRARNARSAKGNKVQRAPKGKDSNKVKRKKTADSMEDPQIPAVLIGRFVDLANFNPAGKISELNQKTFIDEVSGKEEKKYSFKYDFSGIERTVSIYLNEAFNKAGEKNISKKSLKDILLKDQTDNKFVNIISQVLDAYKKPSFFTSGQRRINGAILHFIINALTINYEVQRLIDSNDYTAKQLEFLIKKLHARDKENLKYSIQEPREARGLGLMSSPAKSSTPSKKLKAAIDATKLLLEELLDSLSKKE